MAVFWTNLKAKIKSVVSRQEFTTLKNKVDNDVVLKSMTSNTTITNTGNTIVSAPIVNLTSKSGDLELRVNNTSKSVNCGGSRITGVGNPTANDHAATKQYVDSRTVDLSNYYTKRETDAQFVNVANSQNITGEKTFVEGLIAGRTKMSSDNAGFRIQPLEGNKWVYFGNPNQFYFQGIDLNDRVILQGVRTPSGNSHAANKQYVDSGLNNKANANDVYLKSQTYTRSEIDNKDNTLRNSINSKANSSDVYTRSQVYTKSEVNSKLRYRVHTTNGNITSQKDLGSGVWYYSVKLDSMPSDLTNDIWLELLEIKYNNLYYQISPSQFVRSQRRYLFIASDNFGSSTRFQEIKLYYYNFG